MIEPFRGTLFRIFACFVIAAGLLVCVGAGGPFVYDDLHSIVDNHHLTIENIPRFFWDPSCFSGDPGKAMYRPLLLVSYVLNLGQPAATYRLLNLLLHSLNAVLVVALAYSLGLRRRYAVLAGALFLLHPAGVQPVLYVSARSDTLHATFFLLALYLWRERGNHWTTLVCTGAALLTKETAMILPAAFWAMDHLILRTYKHGFRHPQWHFDLLKRVLPSVAVVAGYVLLQTLLGTTGHTLDHAPRPALAQLSTQMEALWFYAKALVNPVGYVVEPAFAELEAPSATGLFAWAGLLALTLLLGRLQSPIPLICLTLAVLSLAVVMVFPLNILVNYRRLYLPAAFYGVFIAWLTQAAAPHLNKWRGIAVYGSIAAILGQYAWISHAQAATWASSYALWQENVRLHPTAPRPMLYWGIACRAKATQSTDLEAQRHWSEAAYAFYTVTTLTKEDETLHWRGMNNLGSVFFELGNLDSAEECFKQAYSHDPRDPDYLTSMGNIKWMRGLPGPAKDFYLRALEIDPRHPTAQENLHRVTQEELDRVSR